MLTRIINQMLSCFFSLFLLIFFSGIANLFLDKKFDIMNYAAGFVVALFVAYPIFILLTLIYEYLKIKLIRKYSLKVNFWYEISVYLAFCFVAVFLYYLISSRKMSLSNFISDFVGLFGLGFFYFLSRNALAGLKK